MYRFNCQLELIAVPVGCLYRQLYRDDKFISKNDMEINAHDYPISLLETK